MHIAPLRALAARHRRDPPVAVDRWAWSVAADQRAWPVADQRIPPAAMDRRDSPDLHGRFLRRDRRHRSSARGSRRWAHSRSGQLLGNHDPVRERDDRAAVAARLHARPRRRGTSAWRRGPGPCGPPSCSRRRSTPAHGRSTGRRETAGGRLGSVARGTTPSRRPRRRETCAAPRGRRACASLRRRTPSRVPSRGSEGKARGLTFLP